MRFRYLKKEGLLPEEINKEEIFNQLMEKILEYSDVTWALFDLLKSGFNLRLSGLRVKGIDEILKRLEEYKNSLINRYNFKSALDEISQKLKKLLEEEMKVLNEKMENLMAERKRLMEKLNFLRNLPSSLSSTIERLSRYEFENEASRSSYEELKGKLDVIKKMEKMLEHFGTRGSPTGFEEAERVLNKLERVLKTIDSLKKGKLDDVDIDVIKDVLGIEGAVSFETLRRGIQELYERGYIQNRESGVVLTPRGIRKIGEKALADIYRNMRNELFGRHNLAREGMGEIIYHSSKPLGDGDLTSIDVVGTIKNAIREMKKREGLKLRKEDFVVYDEDKKVTCSTALLLDLSWSMSWGGKFASAKKVAIALDHLIRTCYPTDSLYLIGFYTVATVIEPEDLPLIDLNVSDPFTNIQDALRLATKFLMRDHAKNKQIILITDGQPTAYFEGDVLQVEWPVFGVSPMAFKSTIEEVKRVTAMGIKINTFMLDTSPSLINFVEEITKINGGRAFFTTPQTLGVYVVSDYVERKRKILH